jgi:ribose 5-phosphate isomerase B
MKIIIAADHAGFNLKEELKPFLGGLGHDVEDKGAFSLDPEDDYPDFMIPAAEAVAKDPENIRGIIIGGSGQGEAMVANRFSGVRAAVYYGGNEEIVRLSREHNNANVLALGARFMDEDEAKRAVELWLAEKFSGEERHLRRLNKFPDAREK